MLIDFCKLQGIIPQDGSITMTIKKNSDGTLGVAFSSRHSFNSKDVNTTYDKDLKPQQDAIDAAKKDLSRMTAFSGTPEDLTRDFEEKITKQAAVARSLADAITESTADLNARIKELKDKKAAVKPAAKKADTATSSASGKKEPAKPGEDVKKPGTSLFDTGLFSGSVAAPGDTTVPPQKPEENAGSEGEDNGADDTDAEPGAPDETEDEELQEVA